MADFITLDDIDEKLKAHISVQDYSPGKLPEGVKLLDIKNMVGEDGDFSEIFRFSESGQTEQFPNLKIAQINRSCLSAGCLKAWHLHLKQDEIWYVPPHGKLTVGLFDIRKNSPTNGLAVKIVLGGTKSQLLFIPKGVAHGCANFSRHDVDLFYFVSKKFDISDPDEKRLPWDICGEHFFKPEKS